MLASRLSRDMLRYFDWPLLIMVLLISLFGMICIFAATTTSVQEVPATIAETLSTQPTYYPRLHLAWIFIGLAVMSVVVYFSYEFYGSMPNAFYIINILMLLFVLLTQTAGRGGMTAFVRVSSSSERTFQPSEFGKFMIIIALSKPMSERTRTIKSIKDAIPMVLYVVLPLVFIIMQPDVGTALVYIAVLIIMLFVSGTSWKLIGAVLATIAVIAIPAWYLFTSSGNNFRITRILMWLHPEDYPDEARQVINAQIAIGSGGLFGKGIVSVGSFASLGYISDDHTDFIFAIVCEAFGMVGGISLVAAYIVMIVYMLIQAMRCSDNLGSYMIIGVASMFIFHVVENICMVIGLLPVTGIPLPFVSYGGSNMITNMVCIGLVENVIMRDRYHKSRRIINPARAVAL